MKRIRNKREYQKSSEFGKDFFVNLVTTIQKRVGTVIGICLTAIGIFIIFSLVLSFVNYEALKRSFESPYFGVVKLAVIVVVIYTLISTADFIINFILVRLPADVINSARDEFLLKMNLNVVRYANGNPITAFLIRLFNYVSLSPSIINSPTVNFLMGFISIFGVVFILFLKHVFLWIFNRFIKPIYQPILDRILKKVHQRKEKIAQGMKEKNIIIQSDIKKQAEKISAAAKRYQWNKKDAGDSREKTKKAPK